MRLASNFTKQAYETDVKTFGTGWDTMGFHEQTGILVIDTKVLFCT